MLQEDGWLLGVALNYFVIGRSALALGNLDKAGDWLNRAVDSLRESGTIHHIPRGLLARATFFRKTEDFASSRRDLAEVKRLAARCGMLLFECDAHLEYARLALAEGNADSALSHFRSAEALVSTCGYHRRDPKVAELKKKFNH